MSTEQFSEITTLLTEYGSPVVTCLVILMILAVGYTCYKMFVCMRKEKQEQEMYKMAIDIIRNDINHVKAFRRTENIESYNYYVDCLIEDLDKLYNK